MNTDADFDSETYGYGYWWLRTPSNDLASFACVVHRFGSIHYDDNGVSDTSCGVRTAINLSTIYIHIIEEIK